MAGAPRLGPATETRSADMGREGCLQRNELHPVAGQIQLANDRGSKEADHVGEHREGEARKDLFAHGGSAHQVPALQNQHLVPGFGQIGGSDQAVVPGADDDGIVGVAHHDLFLGGLKNGVVTTVAPTTWRRYSTVISNCTRVPTLANGAATCASARFFFSVGDQTPLVA